MTLVIIDLGIGNGGSVTAALDRVGASPLRTDRPADLAEASAIILPGVGSFGDGMARLRQCGLEGPLVDAVRRRGVPLLGICLGMHLLAERGEEHGRHEGLGLIGGAVVRLDPPPESRLRVPNMGWCDVEVIRPTAIMGAAPSKSVCGIRPRSALQRKARHHGQDGHGTRSEGDARARIHFARQDAEQSDKDNSSFYFAHSYHLVCSDPADVCARVHFGGPVTAAVARGRIFGVQFHPEKSQDAGLDLLAAFVAMAGAPLPGAGAGAGAAAR